MRKFLTFLIVPLILCYPFAVYFGLNYFSPRYIAITIAFIFFLRFIVLKPAKSSFFKVLLILTTFVGVSISLIGAISNNILIIKLYPVMISLLMFTVFLYSIFQPPTIIERLARLKTPKLSPTVIHYTKKVTIAWSLFFIVNGLIALWTTFFAATQTWAFYNGFLSYILIGIMFTTEFIIRQHVKLRAKDN